MPTAPIALHFPVSLLQHVEAQSALLKHCPVMNWLPFALPTFCAPGRLELMAGLAVTAPLPAAGAVTGAGAGAGAAAPPPKPQFSMPTAPIALHFPVFLLQHVDAQSALLRHWPVINWLPSALPTFCEPGRLASTPGLALVAGVVAAGAATTGGGAAAAAPPPAWNPHLSIPTAPMALQLPVSLLQQADAQSALLRHWPVMNWLPSPFPTFWEPGLLESMAGLAVTGAAGAGAGAAPPALKPQFSMPTAPMALQRPVFLLQHVDAQSALEKHCPVMNWSPFPLPTFAEPGLLVSTVVLPAGAGAGAARAVKASGGSDD